MYYRFASRIRLGVGSVVVEPPRRSCPPTKARTTDYVESERDLGYSERPCEKSENKNKRHTIFFNKPCMQHRQGIRTFLSSLLFTLRDYSA